jgi:MYXO-CTERM domain-containing protein
MSELNTMRNNDQAGNRALRLTQFLSTLMLILFVLPLSVSAQENPENGAPQGDGPNAQDLSETQTAFTGARLLRGDEQVRFARLEPGLYEDDLGRDRYAFWEGHSLFAGVIDDESGNRIDAVAEFYWFESSVPRDSDFYVVVLKVAAAPTPSTSWNIATTPSLVDDLLFRDIGPVQRVRASMDRTGQFGAIRWDWSVPFQNYRWEPYRTIEVEQEYTAGVRVDANAHHESRNQVEVTEGSSMRSLTEGVNVQAKGFMDANAKVSTRYTITLWRWEMLVQGGATDMEWNMSALEPDREHDPAYHEYFLVIQAPRGQEARIEGLDIGATFRNRRGGIIDGIIPDTFLDISARVADIVLTPPHVSTCPDGFVEMDGECYPECEEGFKPVAGECIPDCPEGFEALGDGCVPDCEDGYEPRGNRCLPICEMHERYYRGRCIPYCEEGERLDGEDCVAICDDGEEFHRGRCHSVCEDDEYYEDGQCIARCERGERFEDDECVPDCDSGFRLEGSRCVPDCGPGFRAQGERCVLDCPPSTHEENGRCVRNLRCGEGTRLENGVCVSDGDSTSQDSSKDGDIAGSNAQGGCSVSTGSQPDVPAPLVFLLAGLAFIRRFRG